MRVDVRPRDAHNLELLANVHPPDWQPPTPAPRYNLVVIGAGTAGLVAAAGAAGLGARVALVERELMGGDCLNVGCVPSKCVIRPARTVAEMSMAASLGVRVPGPPAPDFGAIMERMRGIRARLSRHDSAARFCGLGVDVFLGEGRFTGPGTITVGGRALRFRKAVVATGGRAGHPAIPGLAETGFLTNETVFELAARPARLVIIGAGPIGCELAQAFARLGSEVTLIHTGDHILSREDTDAAEILQRAFAAERIRLVLGSRPIRVERAAQGKVVHVESPQGAVTATADEILVAAGRVPNVEGLGLEAAGIAFDHTRGIKVDDHLRTSNARVYAAGDVCMEEKFTHGADFAARTVIQNALFLGRKKLSGLTIPWCTYTDPEIARVGLSESQAATRGVAVDTFVRPFSEVDRAVIDGEEEGFVKIHVRRGTDRIVGATVVGRHAGEMIGELTLAMTAGIGLGRLASVIHPYPTRAEAIRQVGDMYNRTRLTPAVKRLFATWLGWTR